jgi:hypothetical protein
MGRPSNYPPDLCELAHNYCLLGATNDVLAELFGVSPRTIDNWIAGHPEFAEAVQQGRDVADATAVEFLSRASPATTTRREGLRSSRRTRDGDLHRTCSARNQGLYVLAAQPPAGGLAREGGNGT